MTKILLILLSIASVIALVYIAISLYYNRVLNEAIKDSDKGLSDANSAVDELMVPNKPEKVFISGKTINDRGRWISSI